MKKLVYILLFLGLQLAAFSGNSDKVKTAANRTIAGKITDSYGEAIAGAKVTVSETGEAVFADMDGNFRLTVKTDRVYSITVNTIGFEPLQVASTGLGAFSDIALKSL